jgi:hypothetical protein
VHADPFLEAVEDRLSGSSEGAIERRVATTAWPARRDPQLTRADAPLDAADDPAPRRARLDGTAAPPRSACRFICGAARGCGELDRHRRLLLSVC